MLAREPGDPPRADLAAIGDESAQHGQVLVVDLLDVDPRVLARPHPIGRPTPPPGRAGALTRRHQLLFLFSITHARRPKAARARMIATALRLEGDVLVGGG